MILVKHLLCLVTVLSFIALSASFQSTIARGNASTPHLGSGVTIHLPLTSSPTPFSIINIATLSYRDDTRGVQGTIVNNSSIPLTNIQVQVQLIDTNGQSIGSVLANTSLPIAFPNQPLPYEVTIPQTSAPVSQFIPRVVRWTAVDETDVRPLTIVDVKASGNQTISSFTVVLRNDTSSTIGNVDLLIWSITTGTGIIPQRLPNILRPGESITVEVSKAALDPLKVQVIAQGKVMSN